MEVPANRSSRTQVSSATRKSLQGRPASADAPLLAETTTLPHNLQVCFTSRFLFNPLLTSFRSGIPSWPSYSSCRWFDHHDPPPGKRGRRRVRVSLLQPSLFFFSSFIQTLHLRRFRRWRQHIPGGYRHPTSSREEWAVQSESHGLCSYRPDPCVRLFLSPPTLSILTKFVPCSGMACTAGPNGDACLLRCRNPANAGPFGSCVAVAQDGAAAGNATAT
jgi:hypothetical protein